MDHWALISAAGDGKSTFISKMAPEYCIVDLDKRFDEQSKNVKGKVHVIRESEPLKIVLEMERLFRAEKNIKTVAFDSGTSLLDLIVHKGQLQSIAASASGSKFNMNTVHQEKAATMRTLRLTALKANASVVWVFHYENGMQSGQAHVRTTIPKMELDRLKSNLNAILTIVKDGKGNRGIRIEWCRYNNDAAKGQVVWDIDGMWENVPQKLSIFLREFKGSEGYNGNQYSIAWLSKKIGVEDARAHLKIEKEPLWFDRNAWMKYVEVSGVQA